LKILREGKKNLLIACCRNQSSPSQPTFVPANKKKKKMEKKQKWLKMN